MISLKDEIKKFQNLVYNRQLAEFVTVDQIFMGGGITIESMIHESHFIVQQLKKIRDTFLNYCKLNDKVYTRIMQHQLNLHNQFNRISNIGGALDRKIEDTMKNMQSLHQSTIRENIKSAKMLQSSLQPIRKELQKKVDKQTFEAEIKKIIIQHQDQDYIGDEFIEKEEIKLINENKQRQELVNSIGGAIFQMGMIASEQVKLNTIQRTITNKSKNKVGSEELTKLQVEIDAKMKLLEQQLQSISNAVTQNKDSILKQIPSIAKSVTQCSINRNQIYRLNKQIEEQEKQFRISFDKLSQDLNKKTNDQVWRTKLQFFYDKQIVPHIIRHDEALKKIQKEAQEFQTTNNQRIYQINSQFPKIKSEIQNIQSNIKKHSKDLNTLNQNINTNYQQFCKQRASLSRNIENFKMQSGVRFRQIQKSIKLQVQQLQQTIQALAKRIEQAVLKIVNKRVSAQLKVIELDIKQNRDKTKETAHDVTAICDQINNIKDILSRKANFTDIVLHIEKKTDLQDFKQLQYRVHQTSQHLISKKSSESVVNNLQKPERKKVTSITRTSKTMLAGRSTTTNRLNKTDLDISTKLFMCGIDVGNQFTENQVHFRQNPKKKIIKSSTAAVNDFV